MSAVLSTGTLLLLSNFTKEYNLVVTNRNRQSTHFLSHFLYRSRLHLRFFRQHHVYHALHLRQLIEAQVKSLEAMNHQIQSKKEERDIKEEVFRKSDIYSHFHSQDSISITEQEWEELKIAIDDTYDNFTGQLYTLYPKLSTIEMRICLLIKISITVTNISMLLGRSKSTVSTARSKLYEKLQGVKGTPGLLDQFIVGL